MSFTRAVLLGGLDAPTGGQAQTNPQPVLLRLADHAFLPNRFRGAVKECLVIGAGYGDISAERAYIRTENLSCVRHDGRTLEVKIHGSIFGEDGKVGVRGRLVSKQGQILANALTAGVVSGIGQAFQSRATTTALSPLGAVSAITDGKELEAGLSTGVGRAHGSPGAVLHRPGREDLPGDRSRRRSHRRCGADPGRGDRCSH